MTDSKQPLLKNDEERNDTVPRKKLNPMNVREVSLANDFYTLTWTAIRVDAWEGVKIKDQQINLTESDHIWLHINFLSFVAIVLVTVGILVFEAFTTDYYHEAGWPIIILRITLVGFAQRKLVPEIYQGMAKTRYTLKHQDEFCHMKFAVFVGLCQTFVAIVSFLAIMLFVCMANEALELIMNFAGLAVISELDDWIGEQICTEKPHVAYDSKFKDSRVRVAGINDRMKLLDKLALLDDEEKLTITDDQNVTSVDNFILRGFWFLVEWFPWLLFPLLTLPLEWSLVRLQPHGLSAAHSE